MRMDPWSHMISQLAPNIQHWQDVAVGGSTVKATISLYHDNTVVVIEEYWPDGEFYYSDKIKINKACRWVYAQLKKHTNVQRLTERAWEFASAREAEKFITLFNLKWTAK